VGLLKTAEDAWLGKMNNIDSEPGREIKQLEGAPALRAEAEQVQTELGARSGLPLRNGSARGERNSPRDAPAGGKQEAAAVKTGD
jgi:hypothetical protein